MVARQQEAYDVCCVAGGSWCRLAEIITLFVMIV